MDGDDVMANTALLVIDMQKGLLNRQVFNKGTLIANVNRLLDKYHAENGIVIFVRHTNTGFSKINTTEWQIDNNLTVTADDIVVNKSHSSIFKEKDFIELLHDRKIDNIVISGFVSNGCVQAACIDGIAKGLNVTLISDAHSTWHKDAEKVIQDWNIKLALKGVQVLSTDQFVDSNNDSRRMS